MGIQINGQTDIISASDGSLTVSGASLPGVTNLDVNTITGVSTAGITSAYIGKVYTTSGVDITNNIIQVVASKNDSTSGGNAYITSGTYTYTGYSASITPKINGSTILIDVNFRLGSSYASSITHYWLVRDNGGNNLPSYTNTLQFFLQLNTGSGLAHCNLQYIHTNVTGAQTYKLYGAQGGGNGVYAYEPIMWTLREVRV
jgi:hypothetical protein